MTRTTLPRRLFAPALAMLAGMAGCQVSYMYLGSDVTPLAGTGGASGTGGAATTASSSGTGAVETTTTTGGTGATDGGLPCVPGTTRPCYDGPAGTEGVGTCKAGVETCAGDGESWGTCSGEVLPQPANCASGKDLHCDGSVPPCKGTVLWAKQFGDTSDQYATAVAADASGDVIVGGYFLGMVNFGGGVPLMSTGADTIFVAKLDGSSGGYLWANGYGTGAARGVAAGPSGSVLVAGYFSGTVDFGGGVVTSSGKSDAFVLSLSSVGGYQWVKHFGVAGASSEAAGVAVDGAGNVLLTGYFSGSVDFGCGSSIASTGPQDIFLTKLDGSTGGCTWVKHFGDPGDTQPEPESIAVDAFGNVLVGGSFSGSTNFGGGPLVSVGASDALVFEVDSSGNYKWANHFGSMGQFSDGRAVASGPSGVFLTGDFAGTVDFGGGPVEASGASDTFLLKLDPVAGAYAWGAHFGDGTTFDGTTAGNVAVDLAGNAVVAGAFSGSVKFGGPPIMSAGGLDVFTAKLDTAGGDVWAERFGGPSSNQMATGIATDAAENVLLAGYFSGSIDFGEGPLTTAGGQDIFVAKLSP